MGKTKGKGKNAGIMVGGGLRKIPILYWMHRETQWARMRKRLYYLMPSVPQSSTVRPVVLQVPSPPSWKTASGSRMKPPWSLQGEMVNDLLHHLDTPESRSRGGIHPRVLREQAKVFTQVLGTSYQQSWLQGRSQSTEGWQRRQPATSLVLMGSYGAIFCYKILLRSSSTLIFWWGHIPVLDSLLVMHLGLTLLSLNEDSTTWLWKSTLTSQVKSIRRKQMWF